TGDPNKGNEQYNKLITEYKDKPSLPSNMCFIGDTYLRAGDANTAKSLYDNVLQVWPKDPQSIFAKAGMAKIDLSFDRDNDAKQIIDEIINSYKDNPDIAEAIFGIGDYCRSMAITEREKEVSEANPYNSSYQFLKTGEKVKKYYTKACVAWERIIQDLPESDKIAQAYRFAGECYGVLGQSDKMIENYQIVVDKWPQYNLAWHLQFMIGRHYEMVKRNGKMTESEADTIIKQAYERLIQNYPNCPPAKGVIRWLDSYNARVKGGQL
ncbi:MAG: tetratricopeptide repeat protein, partial [Sedimentisphaerales bacterium]|nr:tetratricopeptide repeat protein [Sedimentisphaerales bacterium]